MRTVVALALLAFIGTAHAGDLADLETKIGGCLVFPVEVEGSLKVTFEVTLDSATKAQKVDVIDYEPKSDAMAKATDELAVQLKKKCWPVGVKEKGPIRMTLSTDVRS